MAKIQKSYNASDITVLKGLEGIRENVGMYLGLRDKQVFHAVREIVENSIDMFVKEMNTYVSLAIETTKNKQVFTVIDRGSGIPVENNKDTGISTLTTILTTLHAGSNFKKKDLHKAKSRGKHGIGSSAANAVSELFTVWTCRNSQWYTQSFSKGIPSSDVVKCKFPSQFMNYGADKNKGTIIQLIPDYTVLPKIKVIDEHANEYIKTCANLNTNLEMRFIGKDTDETYLNKEGIVTVLNDFLDKNKANLLGKPFLLDLPDLSIALQWTSIEGETCLSYVNGADVPSFGTHVDGLYSTLAKEFKAIANGKKNLDFTPSDLREGLVAVIHYRCDDDDYSGQNKEKLNSESAITVIRNSLTTPLKKWMSKNKTQVKEIIVRANAIKAAKAEARLITKAASSLKTNNKDVLVKDGKLIMCESTKPEERELFVVEGDSAGGTCVAARDPYFQEILKLRGKVPNVERSTSIAKDLGNKAISNFLIAVGANANSIKKGDKLDSTRVGKIIILADADVDGSHIQNLVITLANKYCPILLENGRIFIVDLPLFSGKDGNNNIYYGKTIQDVQKQSKKAMFFTRFKGLGEMQADDLYKFAFNKESRKLIRLKNFANNDERKMFNDIVGDDVTFRKKMFGIA